MHFVLDGVIISIGDVETWASGFKKREILIKTDEEYSQDLKFDFVNDSCEKLDLFCEGELITIAFTIVSNLYQGKHYTNLRGIAIGERNGSGENKTVKSRHKQVKKTKKLDGDLEF